MLCACGNAALTPFIEKVPDGSFLSCRSPPPQPAMASATTVVASAAVAGLLPVTAGGSYPSTKRPRAGCGGGRLVFWGGPGPRVVLFAGGGPEGLPRCPLGGGGHVG